MLPNLLPDVNTPVRDVAAPLAAWLRETETVFEALARVRTEPGQGRVIYFYVTDPENRLVGVAPVRRLLLAEPATLVGEMMVHPVYSVRDSEPFGAALSLLAQNRLLALPVVDDEGRLTGVVDISAATHALVDLERRESAAELFQAVGVRRGRARNALLTSLAVGLLLAVIVTVFQGVLRRASAVAFFIPSVVTVAGNAAVQAVTIGLQGAQLTRRKRRTHAPNTTGALWFGVAGSAAAGALVALWLQMLPLAIAVACSLIVACAAGTALGCAIPRLVRRWGLDPKIASGPLVSALAAMVALTCYLAASAFLV